MVVKIRKPTKGGRQVLIYLIFSALAIIVQMIGPKRSFDEIKVRMSDFSEGLSNLTEFLSDLAEGLIDSTESRSDYDRSNKTIITALFLLNSTRHADDNYFMLIGKLFSNEDPMIIFTSPELAPKLTKMRGKPKRTVVIPIELEDTKIHKKYPQEEFWTKISARRGPGLNAGLNPQIYWLWNSKVEFLKVGSDLNPFKSKFFAWVDAGIVRSDHYTNTTILQRVPSELPENQIMILHVTHILRPRLRYKKHAQMSAGIFGGYKPGIDSLYDLYYQRVDKLSKNETCKVLSNEQIILHQTCTLNPGLCFVVRAIGRWRHELGDRIKFAYFYMLPFLNTKDYSILERDRLVKISSNPYDGLDDND